MRTICFRWSTLASPLASGLPASRSGFSPPRRRFLLPVLLSAEVLASSACSDSKSQHTHTPGTRSLAFDTSYQSSKTSSTLPSRLPTNRTACIWNNQQRPYAAQHPYVARRAYFICMAVRYHVYVGHKETNRFIRKRTQQSHHSYFCGVILCVGYDIERYALG